LGTELLWMCARCRASVSVTSAPTHAAFATTLQLYPANLAAATSGRVLLVLGHGAGSGERDPFMVTVSKGLAERGIDVVTFEFPYMREKRKMPDKAPVLEAAFREAIDQARGQASGKLFIGGKSMGGRMATHLAAQELEGLSGVVAFGYPLHPPGKPDQPRVAHLAAIRVPMLIVQGAKDPFGTEREIRPVFESLPSRVTIHVVPHGDHSLRVPASAGTPQKEVMATVFDMVGAWIHST
jgi:uncharacterized protein